jgi:hypothetical protein
LLSRAFRSRQPGVERHHAADRLGAVERRLGPAPTSIRRTPSLLSSSNLGSCRSGIVEADAVDQQQA